MRFIIWQLLEYRLDERPWRLAAIGIAYGMGIAESWAFVGFFPVFLAAIVWVKGVEFFNFRFLVRMILWGAVGMLLLLLLPLVAKSAPFYKISFWRHCDPIFGPIWLVMAALKNGQLRHNLVEASLSTILPIVVLALRWSASFGDNSPLGSALANNMMHFVYAVIFSVCIWAAFDPPFSAGQLLNAPALALNYLSALSIGYFCGYFLLVFGKGPAPNRRGTTPKSLLPPALMWICFVIVAGMFIVSVICIGTLIYRNAPSFRRLMMTLLLKFAKSTTETLPKRWRHSLLSDSETSGQDRPIRSLLVHAMLVREGRAANYPVVDTQAANWTPYHQYLHEKYPDKWPLVVKETDPDTVSPVSIFNLLVTLSSSNTLRYLNSQLWLLF